MIGADARNPKMILFDPGTHFFTLHFSTQSATQSEDHPVLRACYRGDLPGCLFTRVVSFASTSGREILFSRYSVLQTSGFSEFGRQLQKPSERQQKTSLV